MIALAALIIAEAVQAPRFAPPVDRPFRYTIVETRIDGGVTRDFAIERHVVFHRDGASYSADVSLVRVDAPAGEVGARFTAGTRALAGRTLRFHLNADGAVASIDDIDAVWTAMIGGLGSLAGSRANPAAAMAALPLQRRIEVLASMIAPIIASGSITPTVAHRIRLASGALGGKPITLDGSENIARQPNGVIHVETTAAGGDAGGNLSIIRSADHDPATGLVNSSRETLRITRENQESIKRTVIELEPLVS